MSEESALSRLSPEAQARVKAEAEAVHDRVMEMTIEQIRGEHRVPRVPGVPRVPRVTDSVTPRVDVDRIVRLYVEENMKPMDIADVMHCNYVTVLAWLKRRRVYDANKFKAKKGVKVGGKLPTEKCANGHDKEPGKECYPCKLERNRKYKQHE